MLTSAGYGNEDVMLIVSFVKAVMFLYNSTPVEFLRYNVKLAWGNVLEEVLDDEVDDVELVVVVGFTSTQKAVEFPKNVRFPSQLMLIKKLPSVQKLVMFCKKDLDMFLDWFIPA